jgi:hypothetical protein
MAMATASAAAGLDRRPVSVEARRGSQQQRLALEASVAAQQCLEPVRNFGDHQPAAALVEAHMAAGLPARPA